MLSNTACVVLDHSRFAPATMTKIAWAVKLFGDWQRQRNLRADDPLVDMSPIRVNLNNMTADELNFSISRFIVEVRKVNGDEYPGTTLKELVVMLQLHLQTLGKCHDLLSADFMQLHHTLDTTMKERVKKGVVRAGRQAEVITMEEEEMLWSRGVLGSATPRQLLYTLFYLTGLNFALRAGHEHRNLRFGASNNAQIKLLVDSEGRHFLRYTEDWSKANQGGLQHQHVERKSVEAYEQPANPDRCIVEIYRRYVLHCPTKNRPVPLYLRPLAAPSDNVNVWFACQAVGRTTLAGIVAAICKEGGLTGYRTNHSLRASAATRLYNAAVDEQLIGQVTGHRSTAVRKYKRTTDAQKRECNAIVQGQALHSFKKMKTEPVSATVSPVESVDSGTVPNVHVTVNINPK